MSYKIADPKKEDAAIFTGKTGVTIAASRRVY